ncbi:MAG: hypothetical protein V7K21_05045 [Nostoc sp.]|uniref:hypothetical protein n=1 Tax=Nostoc sp. TaxID=1180 RepID=UPI002FF5307F
MNQELTQAIASEVQLFHSIQIPRSHVEVLESRVEVLESRVEVLESHVEVLESHVEVLESRVEVLESRVEVLESRVEVLKSRVEVLKSRVEVLKSRVGVLQTLSHCNQVQRCDTFLFFRQNLRSIASKLLPFPEAIITEATCRHTSLILGETKLRVELGQKLITANYRCKKNILSRGWIMIQ